MTACRTNGDDVSGDFVEANKIAQLGAGASRQVTDYRLTRYAVYLIAQCFDPSKPQVAAA